jgi:hypothetical protein
MVNAPLGNINNPKASLNIRNSSLYVTQRHIDGVGPMMQFKIAAARALAEQTGMGELQALRHIQMMELGERRRAEDRRAQIRDILKPDRRTGRG